MKLTHMALGACIPLVLVACGSGDGPEKTEIKPLPEPSFTSGDLRISSSIGNIAPPGIYQFSITSDTSTSASAQSTGQTANVTAAATPQSGQNTGIALISSSGRMSFATGTRQGIAFIKPGEGERFTADLQNADVADTYKLDPSGEQSVDPNRVIKGQQESSTTTNAVRVAGTIEDATSGTLVSVYDMVRDKSISGKSINLTTLAGTFRETTSSGITTNLTVAGDGTLTGSDTTGCQYAGEIIIPASGVNLVEAKYQVSGCGPSNGLSAAERNGTFFALGYSNAEEGTLTMFGASSLIATRFKGTDVDVLQSKEAAVTGFVNANLTVNDPVVQTLHPGNYDFTEIIPPPADPTATPKTPETGDAILSPTGRLFIATESRLLRSHVRVSDTLTFTANASESVINQDAAPNYTTSTIFGAPEAENSPFSIIGSLIADTGELGVRYRITRKNTMSDRSVSLASISGSYMTTTAGGITTTFTIGADGSLTGSDTTGCQFLGRLVIPDPTLNIVEARFDATGCTASFNATGEVRNGTFNAIGRITAGSPQGLDLMMDNGSYSTVFTGTL
ncbi:hypothetical protein [Marinobacter subterrani]|uniref:hypothetical protein n=1 Tax=Marinobacter subterrani TaxID=1658765 RepID=UPI0023551A3A|nr:hypothetical protein [Marinobacter subterrani]